MAAPFHPAVVAARKEERLAFLMTPWVDKAVAAIALVPFICLTYVRFRAFGVDLPLRGGWYSFAGVRRYLDHAQHAGASQHKSVGRADLWGDEPRASDCAPLGDRYTCHPECGDRYLGTVKPRPQHRTGSGVAHAGDPRSVPICALGGLDVHLRI